MTATMAAEAVAERLADLAALEEASPPLRLPVAILRGPSSEPLSTEAADPDGLRHAAQDPQAGPEALRSIVQAAREELSERDARLVFDAVARHPNADLALLAELVALCPRAVAANPALPLLPLEHPDLLDRFPEHALSGMLTYPHLPPAFVALCRRHSTASIAERAARHVALARDYDPAGTEWQDAALEALSRLGVFHWESLWELIEEDWVPRELAERLGFAAVHEPEHEKVREFGQRRREAALLPRAPDDIPAPPEGGWQARLRDNYLAAMNLAHNPRTPPDALREFVRYQPTSLPDPSKFRLMRDILIIRVLGNVGTPPDVLEALRDQSTAESIAAHPNATPRLLRLVLTRGEEVMRSDFHFLGVVGAIVSNPVTQTEIIYEALESVRRSVSFARSDTRMQAALLRRFLRWHPALKNRDRATLPALPSPYDPFFAEVGFPWSMEGVLYLLTARHPSLMIPPRDERSLAASTDWTHRFAAALNAFAPDDLRNALAEEDADVLVRAAARARRADPTGTILGVPGDPGREWAE